MYNILYIFSYLCAMKLIGYRILIAPYFKIDGKYVESYSPHWNRKIYGDEKVAEDAIKDFYRAGYPKEDKFKIQALYVA